MIVFLSEGRINTITEDGIISVLNCVVADKYREREREIKLRNEWKQSGAGALFTGSFHFDHDNLDVKLSLAGLARNCAEKLIFSVNFEKGGGMYFKHIKDDGLETPILVNQKITFYELSVNKAGFLAVSCAENAIERHIAILKIEGGHLQNITEGECLDCNPAFSQKDDDVLYYDSAGIGYDSHGRFAGYGPRSIYRLNIKTGELDEILEGDKFEYTQPFEDAAGSLYYIKRPYKTGSGRMSAKDMFKAPGKIFRTLGGWLDFKSKQYTGESLKTGGSNPAKNNAKSQQQLFIDGNLLQADKALKQNAQAGDKNPGFVPRDWQLIKRDFDGNEEVLHNSVMSYGFTDSGIIFSNGKFIVDGKNATKAHLATKLIGGGIK